MTDKELIEALEEDAAQLPPKSPAARNYRKAAARLRALAAPEAAGVEPRGCPTPGACSCPFPPSPTEPSGDVVKQAWQIMNRYGVFSPFKTAERQKEAVAAALSVREGGSSMRKAWVFYGTTESGDYYGPAVFDYPVTKEEIGAELERLYPGVDIKIRIWEEVVNTKNHVAEAAEAENARLRKAADQMEHVCQRFERDREQGYKGQDAAYVLDMMKPYRAVLKKHSHDQS